ncbi:MAG: Maf family protein [Clostridiales bacterium]|nr:Maf family protein [Clostridiales bacterium]
MMKKEMILASGSPRRRDLLQQVGLSPVICPSRAGEEISETRPELVVQELASRKAKEVASHYAGQDVIVLGADTVVSIDHEILGKPGCEQKAIEMITRLQGRAHQVYTGVSLIFTATKEQVTFAEKTDVHVAPMTPEQIRRYVAEGESLDKAGAYGIQGKFAAYVTGISGDYNNVVGLPLAHVCQILRKKMEM